MKFDIKLLLKLFVGLVFISAGIYRIFHWQQALSEMNALSLPLAPLLVFLVIVLEIIGGFFLIFNISPKAILVAFILLIVGALGQAMIVAGPNLLKNIGELFFFNPTPTDFFLHLTYLVILIYLLLLTRKSS